jgi:hypothetical protein
MMIAAMSIIRVLMATAQSQPRCRAAKTREFEHEFLHDSGTW